MGLIRYLIEFEAGRNRFIQDSIFRVRDDAGSLRIEPLPYSLEDA